MSSSESEEFESADESFEDDKSSSKISKEVLNNRGKNIISKNLQSAEKGNEPRIEPEESKVDLIIGDLEKDIEEEIVKAIEEIVKEEREEIISKQTDEKNKAIIEIIAQTPEDNKNEEINTSSNSTPDFQADGWEFDNWGEEDLPKDTKSGNIKTISTAKTHSAEKKDDSIELDEKDDWDFEDWGDGNISEMESNSVNKSLELESGPVLKNIANSQPQISGVFDKLTSDKSSSGWGSWGNVASFLSSASESVASLTTNVSKGISNVIESGIGVPDPTELAKIQQEHEKKLAKQVPTPEEGSGLSLEPTPEETLSLNRLVSGVTQISNRVITGGLDTLEGIGKKTMNILQENDPLLLNKRKMLGLDSDRPVLSQVLREAKQKTEETEKNLKAMQKHLYKKQIHFETLFDDYHGLVHLEALEMLSKQSSLKLQSLLAPLSGKALQDLQETLSEVRELCELPDSDSDDADGLHTSLDLKEKLDTATEDLGVVVEFNEIIRCWQENITWISDLEKTYSAQEIHDKAIRCLAQSTALAVHKMHKLAEILLILDHHSTANEADSLVQLTSTLCWHLSGIATRFSDKISEIESTDESSSLITSIFMEGSNSTSYIQKTFQLFIPILQMGAA